MAAKNTQAQNANALITLYIQCFTEKYSRKPNINRYRVKWGFQDMVEDLGYGPAREVVEYYFKTARQGHQVEFLLMNYEKVFEFMEEKKKDEEKRAELRRQTEERVKELESKNDG
ncbi:hypothetical protein SEA_COMRADE_55 [Streptomyces phage Comrade]|uniref:Uncharacterized protein n=3 Tax=Gilsonvirus comrade TaxID=2846395 RepID=A0A345MDY9_9CAUD|nr:hypothetical protein HWB84_gp191 [Streptomyces phage Comrade]AXH68770.1 hypothetical protein SEA_SPARKLEGODDESS_55 [Streptomyces phage SparkleGoddess]QQO39741.1 hypothetical protein SEA_BELFORT_56 [Streptomyces phage Belfort]QZE11650.1 hypothetical protein SEA_KARP_53 [Streptomyces phage Karp]UTN92310.1 hypothetical protein SEA_STIGMA_54 [Streptomyces phage Stigma]AXQ63327.1 hypothetical protein SEA_COMRADE_55 [Streptomyces phage Comrade]